MRVRINVSNRFTDVDVSEERDEFIGMKAKSRPVIIEAANRALAALGEPPIKDEADLWDDGFTACANEHMKQREDPQYPIHRPNPYRKEK